jgi:hypothetical protein
MFIIEKIKRSGCLQSLILIGIGFVLLYIFVIYPHEQRIKLNQLLKESPVIYSCRNPNGIYLVTKSSAIIPVKEKFSPKLLDDDMFSPPPPPPTGVEYIAIPVEVERPFIIIERTVIRQKINDKEVSDEDIFLAEVGEIDLDLSALVIEDKLALIYYSEGKRIDENALRNLKTVVLVRKDGDCIDYDYLYGRTKFVGVRVYNADIEFFDLTNKQCEKSSIENTYTPPRTINSGYKHYLDDKTIIKVVKSKMKQ